MKVLRVDQLKVGMIVKDLASDTALTTTFIVKKVYPDTNEAYLKYLSGNTSYSGHEDEEGLIRFTWSSGAWYMDDDEVAESTKAFALTELGDTGSPMIGVIANVEDTEQGMLSFRERFIDTVKAHFVVDEFNYEEIPDIFTGAKHYDVDIEMGGYNFTIRITETWIY